MSNPGGTPEVLRGRKRGSLNKTTEAGRAFARRVLEDEGEDIDRIKNPVLRMLKFQIRNGVGPAPTQMPASAFNALMDRAYGKVVDRAKLTVGAARPYEDESEEELASRAEELAKKIREGVAFERYPVPGGGD